MTWQKGQSGNPSGGPKHKPITDALRRRLLENDAKALNTIVNVWVSKAMAGDIQALTQVIDRLEGKPLQQIESHNVNENHYVRAPEKASKDDWGKYLDSKQNLSQPKVDPRPVKNGSSNGKSH